MASKNITKGPTNEFCIRESRRSFLFLNVDPIFSYLTLACGGYIIKKSPITIGIDVEST